MSSTRPFTADLPVHRAGFFESLTKITGAICHPLETWKWLQMLKSHPLLSELVVIRPSIDSKIYRPYLSRRLDCAQRAAALSVHYDLMLASGFGELAKQAAVDPVPLCVFISRAGIFYRLELSTTGEASNTGEMVLRLTSRGVCIYTVTFSFTLYQGKRSVTIGSLTGLLKTGSGMSIKRVTRDLHGCRPKDLMVSLVQEIGAFFCCEKTVLISNRNKLRKRGKRTCRKSSDYDRTWKELHASVRHDGNFELPCTAFSEPPSPSPCASRTPSRRGLLLNSIHASLRRRLLAEQASGMPLGATFKMRA